MIEQSEELTKIRDAVMSLTELPIVVYCSDVEAHAKIDMLCIRIWAIRNTDWYDKKAMNDRKVKEYLERIKIESCIAPAKIIGIV